jgi:rhamnogalacturonan endolyase
MRRWARHGLWFTFLTAAAFAVPLPTPLEKLQRGLIALKHDKNQVFVSWRLLGSDPAYAAFNLYRANGDAPPVKLNASPLSGPTCYSDSAPGTGALRYFVRPVLAGQEYDPSESFVIAADAPARSYLEIPIQRPADGVTPGGDTYSYTANDGSIGDVDGDGAYEYFVKWTPTNAKDNSQRGTTGNVYLDAYKLDGTRLWRIDLGRNIRAGAHYTQFIVFDLDGDGRAELACKTADATIDGVGKVIGDASADHRNPAGYVLRGPEFLTVFNGLTGAAIDTVPYVPSRHPDTQDPTPDQLQQIWGDGYGNRVDRHLAGVACLDGKTASLIMARGYYTRTCLAAWDLRDGKLVKRWLFDSAAGPESNRAYAGQGDHSLVIADVDDDGRDEIVYGAMTIDDDGKGLYSTHLQHGDALHVSDLDPTRPGLESYSPHESPRTNGGIGTSFRDARTGEVLWTTPADHDNGRGVAFDIDPRHPGAECWAANNGKLYNAKGKIISDQHPRSMNFAVWWDGDPQRELLDRTYISKWNWADTSETRLLTADGCSSNNGTKSNPVLSGDIFGDWREEVIWRTSDSSALRIYSTTIPTPYRLVTLLHDRQYRFALAWQNVAYNQPPHPSFDMATKLARPATK